LSISKNALRNEKLSKNDRNEILKWQHNRLNYFLIASAFLVATFFQLASKDHRPEYLTLLIHFVAALGSAIAGIYCFINISVTHDMGKLRKKGNPSLPQTAHTWVIPALFLLFWILSWILVTNWWYSLLVILAMFLAGLLFLRIRDWIGLTFDKYYKELKRLFKKRLLRLICGYFLEFFFLGLYCRYVDIEVINIIRKLKK
jgi:hypothetical protein